VITTQRTELLTVTEAARELGATRSLVHYHRLYGRLPAIVIDRKYLIPREAVEALHGELLARHGQKNTVGS
jgi:excisionase family DNA binding protein